MISNHLGPIELVLEDEADVINGSRHPIEDSHHASLYRLIGREITDSQNAYKVLGKYPFECFWLREYGTWFDELFLDILCGDGVL